MAGDPVQGLAARGILALTALPLLLAASLVQAERLELGRFSSGELDGWKQQEFAGLTRYRLVRDGESRVLEATSEGTASAWYLKRKIDLRRTPILNWSWQKVQSVEVGDEAQRAGDDFVARLYVVKDGGVLFWRTIAINYVWSNHFSKGDAWNNPFAGSNARMLSLRDAGDPSDEWFAESRDVQQDFLRLHGEQVDSIDGIAIMTDTDNSPAELGIARYGDIFFSSRQPGPRPK